MSALESVLQVFDKSSSVIVVIVPNEEVTSKQDSLSDKPQEQELRDLIAELLQLRKKKKGTTVTGFGGGTTAPAVPGIPSRLLLEDGVSSILMEDGVSDIMLET